MLRRFVLIIALAFASIANAEPLNYNAFATLPIQHEGRIKPLQTFALMHVQQISGTTHLGDASAIEWLAAVMFNPSQAIEQPLFLLKDADAQLMLDKPDASGAVVALGNEEALKETPRQYLNRLSDLMFVLARVLNRHRTDGTVGDDVYWKSERMAAKG